MKFKINLDKNRPGVLRGDQSIAKSFQGSSLPLFLGLLYLEQRTSTENVA